MKLKTRYEGFTILEMLLYVSICSVLLLSLCVFLVFLLESRTKNQSIADVNQQGQQVMQLITQTIRNARTVDAPQVGQTSQTLTLTVNDTLLSPTVFDLESGIIRIQEASGPNILLTNSHVTASSMLFRNISSASSSDRIVEISFTIDYKNPSGRNEYSFGKTFTGSATLRQ